MPGDTCKVVIAGSRDFNNYSLLMERMDLFLQNVSKQIIIISGHARGADSLGEQYAKDKGYLCEIFPADWAAYGRSAGYRRNVAMASIADAVVVFWDGKSRGTQHMINIAKEKKLPIRVVKY